MNRVDLGLGAILLAMTVLVIVLLQPPDNPNGIVDTNSSYSATTTYSENDIPGVVWWIAGVGAVFIIISSKSLRGAAGGAVSGLFSRPKAILWGIGGFIATILVLMMINPDPTSFEYPPGLIALVVAVLCAGAGSV